MKKVFYAVLMTAMVSLTACHKDLWNALDGLDVRVTKLEELCKEMNTNISSLQTIVNVIQTNDFITSITEIKKGNDVIGYTITFGQHNPITIYNGADGKDGQNGANGKDGHTPIISVARDADGVYYWKLDGTWLLDDNGQKIRVTGKDGKDGADGKDGKNGENGKDGADGKDGQNGANGQDGVTPQLKIENDYWYISYDNGTTWTQLGKAKGDKGDAGATGAAGKDGDSMFKSVTQDDSYVYFTLADGSVIKINKIGSDFDQTIIDNLVTSISLDKTLIYMYVGEDTTLVATTKPFTNSKVTWTTNSSCASVDANGHIIANSTGVVSISAKAGDKGSSCTIVIMDESLQNQMSTSATKKILFAPGNLKYTKSSNTFSFMPYQYSYVGETTFSYDTFKDMDLFGFGTSGYYIKAVINIWSCSSNSSPYASGVDGTISGTNFDWGVYNAIGDDPAGTWRTPTQNELKYILNERPCKTYLYTSATVCGVKGLLILSDGGIPKGLSYSKTTDFTINNYNSIQWAILESSGAIFLPNAGRRDTGTTDAIYDIVTSIGEAGYYWTADASGSTRAYSLSTTGTIASTDRAYGCAVRLVKDVK